MSQEKQEKMERRDFISAGSVAAAGLTGAFMQPGAALAASAGRLNGKRVLICLGEFSESLETYYMIYRLREEGALPLIGNKTVKRLQLVVHDFDPAYEGYTEKPGYQIEADVAYEHVDPESIQGLLIPGGRGPEEIRRDPSLVELVNYFLDHNLPIGAMCHGVMVLYTKHSIKGRLLTAYYGLKADIEALGGKFVDQEVVVDRSLVTSRGWPDLTGFMREFIKVLARSR